MNYELLTEKDFKSFSSYIPAIVAIVAMALTIFLIEITHTHFLAAFIVLIPFIVARLALYHDFRKWRKEMVATGYVTYSEFDNLAEKYDILARHWFAKKERVPLLAISLVIIAISAYFFRQDLALKMYGKETTGTVYQIDANIYRPYALIEFYVDGKRYTTMVRVQLGDYVSLKERVYLTKEQVVAKVGQTFSILYSSKDPTINRPLGDSPIDK